MQGGKKQTIFMLTNVANTVPSNSIEAKINEERKNSA